MSVHEQSLADLLSAAGGGAFSAYRLHQCADADGAYLGARRAAVFKLPRCAYSSLVLIYGGTFFLADSSGIGVLWQSISLHSTAGLIFSHRELAAGLLFGSCSCLIGGMALSTSGGVKVMRAIILAKDLGSELGKLSYPSSVHPLSLEGRHLQDEILTLGHSPPFSFFFVSASVFCWACSARRWLKHGRLFWAR